MNFQQDYILKTFIILMDPINKLVDKGNTVLIIEHNFRCCKNYQDYIIDIGYEGGKGGGRSCR